MKDFFVLQDDDEDGGEAYDLAKMSKENGEEEEADPVKVHEIKFDEFGIMDDGLDDATADQLKGAEGKSKITQFVWQTACILSESKCKKLQKSHDLICKEESRETEKMSESDKKETLPMAKTPVSLLQELYVKKGITPKYDLVQVRENCVYSH